MLLFLIIIVFIILAAIAVWFPRYKMMRAMKRMDEQKESDILDDFED